MNPHHVSKIDRFRAARLYAVTDFTRWSDVELKKIEDACRGGADIIQLRSKKLDPDTLRAAGAEIRLVTLRWNVLFIVNDDPELAVRVEADGVHLGQQDASMEKARMLLGSADFLIGKSTHSYSQALQAEEEGADYMAIGPVFASPTKPDYIPVGLDTVRRVTANVLRPVVAIGGIDRARVRSVLSNGAERVAVVRAVFGAPDVEAATRDLKSDILTALASARTAVPNLGEIK